MGIIESNTISIGPEKKIDLIGFDYDINSALEINEGLGPFSSDSTFKYSHVRDPLCLFWSSLETECVAGCCGIDAFNFWPERLLAELCQITG